MSWRATHEGGKKKCVSVNVCVKWVVGLGKFCEGVEVELPTEVGFQICSNWRDLCKFNSFFSILSYMPFSTKCISEKTKNKEKQMFVTATVVWPHSILTTFDFTFFLPGNLCLVIRNYCLLFCAVWLGLICLRQISNRKRSTNWHFVCKNLLEFCFHPLVASFT